MRGLDPHLPEHEMAGVKPGHDVGESEEASAREGTFIRHPDESQGPASVIAGHADLIRASATEHEMASFLFLPLPRLEHLHREFFQRRMPVAQRSLAFERFRALFRPDAAAFPRVAQHGVRRAMMHPHEIAQGRKLLQLLLRRQDRAAARFAPRDGKRLVDETHGAPKWRKVGRHLNSLRSLRLSGHQRASAGDRGVHKPPQDGCAVL
jgi:hypothetical protein